ncbi:MAG: uncharacterized protein K0R92_1036 [Lachnospiraceae bacterium]|jgi:putative membrane protein|nr:uncharacterized protein [Lachnospiraceae bacterium]
MMFGRGNYGNFGNFRGNGFRDCFGFGYWNNGWVMILITVVLIVLAVVILSLLVRKNKVKTSKSAAMETLKMKYVQGEITEEEFLRRKDVLFREL